jgi:dihydroorotate dehydrogenase electron transfer subunit
MLAAVAALCQTEKIPFQLGWEAHMRCGVGLCGSCEVGRGWLTCLDGPVFPFNPVQVSPNQ